MAAGTEVDSKRDKDGSRVHRASTVGQAATRNPHARISTRARLGLENSAAETKRERAWSLQKPMHLCSELSQDQAV